MKLAPNDFRTRYNRAMTDKAAGFYEKARADLLRARDSAAPRDRMLVDRALQGFYTTLGN